MKKIRLLSALIVLCISAKAQCPKYVLLEHFTQASCAPCAAQNPSFEKNISVPNKGILRQVAYHVVWPGQDTMYNSNPREIDSVTKYYQVHSIPNIILNGNKKTASPSSYSQYDIDAAWAETSPVKILVSKIDSPAYLTVKITVQTVGTVPVGAFKLRAAVIEKQVVFAQPPGNDSEKVFPNVFRRWLDSTSTDTVKFKIPVKGNSVTRTYKLNKNPQWKLDQIDIVAFLQNKADKSVLNVGSTTDVPSNPTLINPTVLTQLGSPGSGSTFNFTAGNSGKVKETYTISLTAVNAPPGWEGKLTVAGVSGSIKGSSSSLSFDVDFAGDKTTKNIALVVTPDAASGFATYVVKVKSSASPDAPELVSMVNVISNVTDLIVNNVSGFGDPSITGNASKFEKIYTDALAATGSKTYTTASHQLFITGSRSKVLGNVKSIYFNAGWTFPTMGDDSLIAAFTAHLSAPKKCLFISGQDLGWETWDATNGAPATAASQDFYTNFLNANWLSDGSPETFGVFSEKTDIVFGNVSSSLIDTSVYGYKLTYPDQISAGSKGKIILNYAADDSSKKAGVRAEDPGKFKTVYLSVGLEQIQNPDVRTAILKNSYKWFNDLISTTGYDAAMAKLSLGQNYPNPSNALTRIPLGNVERDITLQVVDVTGRVLSEQKVAKGSTSATVNTALLDAGIYLYRLVDGSNVTTAKTMQVIR